MCLFHFYFTITLANVDQFLQCVSIAPGFSFASWECWMLQISSKVRSLQYFATALAYGTEQQVVNSSLDHVQFKPAVEEWRQAFYTHLSLYTHSVDIWMRTSLVQIYCQLMMLHHFRFDDFLFKANKKLYTWTFCKIVHWHSRVVVRWYSECISEKNLKLSFTIYCKKNNRHIFYGLQCSNTFFYIGLLNCLCYCYFCV